MAFVSNFMSALIKFLSSFFKKNCISYGTVFARLRLVFYQCHCDLGNNLIRSILMPNQNQPNKKNPSEKKPEKQVPQKQPNRDGDKKK